MSSTLTTNEFVNGVCKWFQSKSGYGFITLLSDKTVDIFCHHNSILVIEDQYKYLTQGEYVRFKIKESEEGSPHKYYADEISGIEGGPLMCESRRMLRDSRISYKKSNRDGRDGRDGRDDRDDNDSRQDRDSRGNGQDDRSDRDSRRNRRDDKSDRDLRRSDGMNNRNRNNDSEPEEKWSYVSRTRPSVQKTSNDTKMKQTTSQQPRNSNKSSSNGKTNNRGV